MRHYAGSPYNQSFRQDDFTYPIDLVSRITGEVLKYAPMWVNLAEIRQCCQEAWDAAGYQGKVDQALVDDVSLMIFA